MDIDDFAGDKDLATDRKFILDKNVLHVRRTDPFGFWHCSYEKGGMPEELQGSYTSFDEARKAVEGYLSKTKKEVKEILVS